MHIAGAEAVRQAQNIPIADRVRVDGIRQKQKKEIKNAASSRSTSPSSG
jgi:hypothetical protein